MSKKLKSHKNVKRQDGSLKLWMNEKSGQVHESVMLHNGRVTRKYVGPEAESPDLAHTFMQLDLKDGV